MSEREQVGTPTRRHRSFGVIGSAIAVGALLSTAFVFNSPVALAAPIISGTITDDANGNGAIDTAVGTGAETGLNGVTVELVRTSDNSVVATNVTAGAGGYSLDAGGAGTYKLRVTAPAGFIINPAVDGGAGGITRVTATLGESAPFTTAVNSTINALVRPDFELQLGYLSNPDGIITGAPPFDTDPACSPVASVPVTPTVLNTVVYPAGVDCTKYDDNVRSADNVAFNFAISGSAKDDTVNTVNDVVLRQTVTPSGGAAVNFARIPISCVPPTGGSGGTPPPTSKVEYFDGSNWIDYTGSGYSVPQVLPAAAVGKPIRLTCNKGTYQTGDASTLGTTVRVDGSSPEGSKFISSAELFAVSDVNTPMAVADGPLDSPQITVKAKPTWDLRKGGFYRQDWTSLDPDGAGPIPYGPGFYTYFNLMLGSDRKSGNEPLQQPITFKDNIYFFQGNGTTPVSLTPGVDYVITNRCLDFWPDRFGGYGGQVFSNGQEAFQPHYGPYTADMEVAGSGDCTINQSTGVVTWSGINFGGPYPTQTVTHQSLTAGPYLVANKWVQVWIPSTTLDNLFGDAPNNQAGSGYLWNRATDFDPNGITGNSNFNAAVEPGWCDGSLTTTAADTHCTDLPANDLLNGNTRSNNVAGPTSFVFSPGGFSKYLLKPNGNDRSYTLHDDLGFPHSGDGTIQPGQYTSTWLHWIANGSQYEDPQQCDIWDNTMYKLVSLAEANVGNQYGNSVSAYATSTGANTNPNLLTFEFAHITVTGDDPMQTYDGASGRYTGSWASQASVNCDQPGVTWTTDPTTVAGGIDEVSAVRVSGPGTDDPSPLTPTMSPGSDRLLRVGLLARDTFYTGPHNGQVIPVGVVGANYGKIKSSNLDIGGGINFYSVPSYLPSPENAATDGDRLTWTRAVLGIKKRTIEVDGLCSAPCAADIDINGSTVAGSQIVWEMLPVLNASSSAPAPVPGLTVKDVLPDHVEYDDACTAGLTGGTPADDVQLNTPGPGQTTLIWNLGTKTPNLPLAPLRICTTSDPLAPAPWSVTNHVEFFTAAIPLSHPFDDHTLSLEQTGELKLRKTVDAPLDVLNDDQVWNAGYANFSETVAVQPVRTIEVFPYNGDGTPPGGPTRNPASSFSGWLKLISVIDPKYADGSDVPGTVYYTADAPNTINQDWNVQVANSFPTTWCSSTDGVTFTLAFGAGTCPTVLGDVTGFMFNETTALAPTSDPNKNRVSIPFTLQAGDPGDPLGPDANKPGDHYTNRFTSFSDTFVKNGLPQRLSSNTVRVRTLGFSAGDFVFDDVDGDGLYTDGTDRPVPDGVTINLYRYDAFNVPQFVGTTTTVDGTYLFTDLPDGKFFVEIPGTFFGPGQLLEGWSISPTPAASPANVEQNDDVSHDAIAGPAGSVLSNDFTLSATVSPSGGISGDEPKGDSLHGVVDPTLVTDGFNNYTIDLALQSPAVSIGDRVWLDVDRNGQQHADHGIEPGIVGLTVELLDSTGASIDPDGPGPLTQTLTITGSDGFYSFTGLAASTDYQVKFTLPGGFQFTSQFSGGASNDSNADTTTGIADVLTPTGGANSALTPDEPSIDAGMVNVDLTLDKVRNTATPMYPGGTVTFTLTPHNIGSTNALPGWSVTDVLPAGLTFVSMAGTAPVSIYTCVGATCTAASAGLAAGGTAETILVTATIVAPTAAVTLHNVAYISPAGSEVTEANVLAVPTTATDTSTSTTNNDAQADVPVTPKVSLGDFVWYDRNRNGIQDDGPFSGISGAQVNLYAADGTTLIGSTNTDPNGFYSFTDLLPSTQYVVEFVKPVGVSLTVQGIFGPNATDDSDPDPVTGRVTVTSASDGVNSAGAPDQPTIDAGLVSIDLTLDKALTSGGPFIVGSTVTFTLTPHNDGLSDAKSGWTVKDILPTGLTLVSLAGTAPSTTYTCVGATCTSSVALPSFGTGETILVTATVNASFGGTVHNVAYITPAPIDVPELVPLITPDTNTNTATSPTNNDAQASLSAVSIGDYVWLDVDRDGIQDGTESGVSGVTVELYAADGTTFITSTNTNGSGFYSFTGLLPSTNYVVKVVAPTGDAFTVQNGAGSTTSNDSNVNNLGVANVTSPASGSNSAATPDEPTIDAGLVRVDLALAKQLDTAAPMYPGNTVQFTLTPSNTGTTDALAGWKVTEILPARLSLVSMVGSAGGSSIYTCVANVCTSTATSLAAGASAETIIVTATITAGPAVTAHNVAYISPAPTEVTEVNPLVVPTTSTDTTSTPTNNDAQADVPVTALISIGDTVWLDVNRDGLQTIGEPAVSGVAVELLDGSGNAIDPDGAGPLTHTTTNTDGSGFYSFTGLLPNTSYEVKFTSPTGDAFTTAGSGAIGVGNDSNPNVGTGITPAFTTPADGSNSAISPDVVTIDAGLVRVDLTLDKALVAGGPFPVGSSVTFTLTPHNIGTTDALAGWKVTDIIPTGLTLSLLTVPGSYDCSTSTSTLVVCSSSAVLPAGGTGGVIVLTASVTAAFAGTAHNVAYISPAPTEVTEVIPLVTPDTNTNTATSPTNNDAQVSLSAVSVGDTVWNDTNRNGIQDSGEAGVEGVTVTLYAANGTTVIDTTSTGPGGFYSFTGLLPSTDYVVGFTLPANDSFTTQSAGGSTVSNDSNANISTGQAPFTSPASGSNSPDTPDEPSIDAGLVNVDLALAKALTALPNYYPGKTVTYSLTPSNLGSTDALAGWSVTEVAPSQLTLVSMSGTGYDCTTLPTCVSSLPLAAGATGNVITVTATINADVTGTVHNVAYISPAPTEVTEVNPLVTPITSTDTSSTGTNNDAQADLTSDLYDLALAKTVAVTGTGEDTVIDYDITVRNDGTVDSGTFTFVDPIPAGLGIDVDSITDGGVFNSSAGTVTWTLSGLAPGDTVTVSWTAFVSDFTARPYRNIAEISSDGGAPWGGDNDSIPDTDSTNDGDYGTIGDSLIDNATIDDAGTGDDFEDDADIADTNVEVNYDLALAKSPSATTIDPAGNVVFTITVENQGDVNSGDYTITDTLPAGTAASAASDGGVITPTTVTWDLTDLAPGATRQVTVTVHVTDVSLRPFRNFAEISANGADSYSTPDEPVLDVDSRPDTDPLNDNGELPPTPGGYGTFENPTNDIDDIADVDAIPNGDDDADVAFFDAPVLYDLALITTGPAVINGSGTATFTITVLNQGNVPSGDFQVTDWVPTGLLPIAASDGGVIVGQVITWELTGLEPGESMQITVTVNVSDFLTRPWTDTAEITADSASTYDTDGFENPDDGVVTDDDSTPDTDPLNDVLVDQIDPPVPQYNDPAVDEDDHDVAPLDANIVYDLALTKVLPPNQSFKKGSPINFNILVKNQGNVDSGPITVQDVIPAGLTFVSASDGGLVVGQVVTWELASLAPGAIKTVTVTVTVNNSTLATYINLAEIVSDGSDTYDTPDSDVHDKDSTPDTDITNDPMIDNDDVNIDQVPGDEDDSDLATLDPSKVKKDNSALPPTGSNTEPILLGFGLLGAGALALLASRRRRRSIA